MKNNCVTFNPFEELTYKGDDKMTTKGRLDRSAAELNDYFDKLIADVPAPSEAEISEGIKKILAKIDEERKSQA